MLKILTFIILLSASTTLYAALPMSSQHSTIGASLSPMLKATMPAIVSISGIKRVKAIAVTSTPSGPEATGSVEEHVSTMIGSGVILDAQKGHIVTNAHVVAELEDIEVTLSDTRKFSAKLLGFDSDSDLALLKINADKLTAIKMADSDSVEVGDFVVAIGNPYGFKQTVTSGIVSAIGRNDLGLEGYYDFIQTDADINMGNSGGGLLNLAGELIGINTVILSSSNGGGSIGIGFAIPSNMAKAITLQLANHGHVDRGPFGVQVQHLTPELAEAFAIPNNITCGAIINHIVEKSPAAVAGLQAGDVLVKVNNKTIKDSIHLRILISLVPVGSTVKVQLYRQGQLLTIPVLITDPKKSFTAGKEVFAGLEGSFLQTNEPSNAPIPGVRIIDMSKSSPANKAGLQVGDIIVAATGKQSVIQSIEDLIHAAKQHKKVLLLQIVRDKSSFFIALKG